MFVTFRSTLLVIAALTGSSVAPAQVNPAAEPLIATGSDKLPVAVQPAVLSVDDAVKAVDPLAPFSNGESAQHEEVAPGASLAETVALLRSADPGSREIECLAGAIYFESKSESLEGQLAVGHGDEQLDGAGAALLGQEAHGLVSPFDPHNCLKNLQNRHEARYINTVSFEVLLSPWQRP